MNPWIIQFELTNYFPDMKAETHEQWLDASEAEFFQWAWEDPLRVGMKNDGTEIQQSHMSTVRA